MWSQIINNPTEEEIKVIRNGLREYNSKLLEIDKKDNFLIYLKEAEILSKGLECCMLSLNTFSFQAKPFYEKYGFKVVYIQENYPITSTRYFMEKKI